MNTSSCEYSYATAFARSRNFAKHTALCIIGPQRFLQINLANTIKNNHGNSVFILNLYTVYIGNPMMMSIYLICIPRFYAGAVNDNITTKFVNFITLLWRAPLKICPGEICNCRCDMKSKATMTTYFTSYWNFVCDYELEYHQYIFQVRSAKAEFYLIHAQNNSSKISLFGAFKVSYQVCHRKLCAPFSCKRVELHVLLFNVAITCSFWWKPNAFRNGSKVSTDLYC